MTAQANTPSAAPASPHQEGQGPANVPAAATGSIIVLMEQGGKTTLDQLRPGEQGQIVAMAGETAITQRLMAVGLLPGVQVKVVRFAPLGDPMTVAVRGCQMSLRLREAATVTVAVAAAGK